MRDRERGRPGLVERQRHVHALGEPAVRVDPGVLQPAQRVEPRPGRVDDRPRLHRDRLAGEAVADLGARDPAGDRAKLDHLREVEHRRPCLRRSGHVREAEPLVVRPRVLVDAATAQALEPERGNAAPGAVRPHEPPELLARERGVRPQPGLDRRRPVGAAAVDREQERDPPHEVRRDDPEQRPPLRVRLADELEVAEAEVPQAAVDELGRGARRRAAEVAPVDEGDAKAAARPLARDPGPDDAAADYEQVVRCPREVRPSRSAPLGYGHSGFVHALPPRASVTSSLAYGAASGRLSRAAVISPSGVVARISPP